MPMKDVAKVAIGVAGVATAVVAAIPAGALAAIGAGAAALMSWAVGVATDKSTFGGKTRTDSRGQAIDDEDPK